MSYPIYFNHANDSHEKIDPLGSTGCCRYVPEFYQRQRQRIQPQLQVLRQQQRGVPEMKAFVLIGAPGSGKSTLASMFQQHESAFIVNGDNIREELYGDAAIQGNWVEVHDRIEEQVGQAAERGLPVVLDNTHYRASYRKEAIALLRSYGFEDITAVVVNPSLATCLARNFKRKRHVPDYVIKEMHSKLQQSLQNIEAEGFTSVKYHDLHAEV
jgi:predicted kinase